MHYSRPKATVYTGTSPARPHPLSLIAMCEYTNKNKLQPYICFTNEISLYQQWQSLEQSVSVNKNGVTGIHIGVAEIRHQLDQTM